MSWPAKMDLTPQRGAFSRVLNRLARNTKIVFSPQRGGFSWALCLHDYFRFAKSKNGENKVLTCTLPFWYENGCARGVRCVRAGCAYGACGVCVRGVRGVRAGCACGVCFRCARCARTVRAYGARGLRVRCAQESCTVCMGCAYGVCVCLSSTCRVRGAHVLYSCGV